jgi:PilZ domain
MSSAPSLKNPSALSPSQFAETADKIIDSEPRVSRARRNDRICIGIAVQVSGTDLNGQTFVERARTEHVSRSGACLVLNRILGPDQQLTIRRAGGKTETVARVVGQVGIRPNGYVFGISLCGPDDPHFWGVHFPPTSDEGSYSLLRCTCCKKSEQVQLNEIESSVLEANGILSRACEECGAATFWQALPRETSDKPAGAAPTATAHSKKVSQRKNIRMAMKANACISLPTGARDVATILDVSRGGIAFRSTTKYRVHSWVELAAPYTEGGANIFVAGRIVWQRPTLAGFHEYGVQYVKN